MVSEPDGRQFEERIRRMLGSTDRLDPGIEERLAQARAVAMREFDLRRPDWRLPAAGVAATAVIAALIWAGWPATSGLAPEEIGDLDLLMADESIEFFENLEFYQWLEYELPTADGNAS